jgi:MinD-like ATPase involved in chromosome partitioning or flagellar assembly
LATYLACEAAQLGTTTLLADADTYGGAVAQLLGLLDESPGIAAATRAVSAGALDLATLSQAARQVGPNLRVLTGIVRADRWPELRPAALEEVWMRARMLASLTVVDCGFCLETDEELSYDTAAPRRNGATVATLSTADVVLAVGRADPVGVQRLIRLLPDARDAAPQAEFRVVLTRVRKGPVGGDPQGQLVDSLRRHAGIEDVVLIPEDQHAYDAAMAAGLALHEVAPRSSARAAIQRIARDLHPSTPQGRRRRRGRRTITADA